MVVERKSAIFLALISIFISLQIANAQYPQQPPPQQIINFFFRIYNNDTVELIKLEPAIGYPFSNTIGNYTVKLISEDGKILNESKVDVFFLYNKVKKGGVLVNASVKEFVNVYLSLPYYPEAKRVELYHFDKLIYQKEIETEAAVCGNEVCDVGENQENCPRDCFFEVEVTPFKTTTTLKTAAKTPTKTDFKLTIIIAMIAAILIVFFLLIYKIKFQSLEFMASKKGISLLVKGIYIILAVISISLFLNRIFYFNLLRAEQSKSIELREAATKNLNMLVSNEKCLAFKEKTEVEKKLMDLSLHSLIDSKKLEDFAAKFSEVEPECARDYKFGYRVKVETLPIEISSEFGKWGGKSVFGRILELIDGKKTTFLLDSSESMKEMAGPQSKISCLKDFMNGFIDSLSAGSGIAIFVYGVDTCGIKDLTGGLIVLNGNRNDLKNKINSLYPQGNTPLGEALEAGFIFSKQNGIDTIVLLTDGCQYDCARDDVNYPVEIAEKYKDGIIVHTIGFGEKACIEPLKKIAEITGGEFFDARVCEELVTPKPREQINVNIPSQSWEFGSLVFSRDKALKEALTISIPVDIYFDESKILPGKITITIADGELERFINSIEQACSTNKPVKFSAFFSYPTYIEGDKICMDFPSGKGCQKIACELPVEFSGVKPGNYMVSIQPSTYSIKVIT